MNHHLRYLILLLTTWMALSSPCLAAGNPALMRQMLDMMTNKSGQTDDDASDDDDQNQQMQQIQENLKRTQAMQQQEMERIRRMNSQTSTSKPDARPIRQPAQTLTGSSNGNTSTTPAERGPNQIDIQMQRSQYPYQCFATSCFYSADEKSSQFLNQQNVVNGHCAPGFVRDAGSDSCQREQEKLSAMQTCFQSMCARARCQKVSVTDGHCVGGAFFKQ